MGCCQSVIDTISLDAAGCKQHLLYIAGNCYHLTAAYITTVCIDCYYLLLQLYIHLVTVSISQQSSRTHGGKRYIHLVTLSDGWQSSSLAANLSIFAFALCCLLYNFKFACQHFFKNFLNFLLSLFSLLLIFRCTYVHLKEKQGGTHNSNMILKNLLSSSSLTQFNIVTHIIYSVFAAVNIFLNNF